MTTILQAAILAAASLAPGTAPDPGPPPMPTEPPGASIVPDQASPPIRYYGSEDSMVLPFPPVPPRPPYASAPGGDPLGDVWEMEEVSGWRGVWLRRGKTRNFDGYWTHPGGERIRAPIRMWIDGHEVVVVRSHPGGKYCRYDGTISADWTRVYGRYACTWARSPMHWQAQIVSMPQVTPYTLRSEAER